MARKVSMTAPAALFGMPWAFAGFPLMGSFSTRKLPRLSADTALQGSTTGAKFKPCIAANVRWSCRCYQRDHTLPDSITGSAGTARSTARIGQDFRCQTAWLGGTHQELHTTWLLGT